MTRRKSVELKRGLRKTGKKQGKNAEVMDLHVSQKKWEPSDSNGEEHVRRKKHITALIMNGLGRTLNNIATCFEEETCFVGDGAENCMATKWG